MKIDGQCHCGRVRYVATADPANAGVCHCTDCQVISGSAFRINLQVHDRDIEVSGATSTYTKIAASGNERVMVFCPNCGTHICGMSKGDGPKRISLRLGTCNQRAQLPPRRQIWCQSEMPWLNALSDVPRSPNQN